MITEVLLITIARLYLPVKYYTRKTVVELNKYTLLKLALLCVSYASLLFPFEKGKVFDLARRMTDACM
jgi:hypothetical protein